MIRLSDVRYAFRLWRRHPAMVAVAGLSLGLGVGATTTMYGVVNRVSNYQLGFAEPDRLAVLWTGNAEKGIRQQPPNWEIVRAVLEHGQSFESFGFFQGFGAPVTLSATTEATRVSQMPVDVNALSIVGVKPVVGRTYRLEDFDDVVKQKEARGSSSATRPGSAGSAAPRMSSGRPIHVDGEPRIDHRRHAARLRAGAVGRQHRLLACQRSAEDPRSAVDDRGRPPEAGRLARRGAGGGDGHHPPGDRGARREGRRHGRRGRVAARSIFRRRHNRADVPARRGQLRPADRVRQRREPAARGRRGAAEGAGVARGRPGPDAAG